MNMKRICFLVVLLLANQTWAQEGMSVRERLKNKKLQEERKRGGGAKEVINTMDVQGTLSTEGTLNPQNINVSENKKSDKNSGYITRTQKRQKTVAQNSRLKTHRVFGIKIEETPQNLDSSQKDLPQPLKVKALGPTSLERKKAEIYNEDRKRFGGAGSISADNQVY
jgi:hypothetical protein